MTDVTIKYDPKQDVWKASTGDIFDTEAKAKAYVKATKGNPVMHISKATRNSIKVGDTIEQSGNSYLIKKINGDFVLLERVGDSTQDAYSSFINKAGSLGQIRWYGPKHILEGNPMNEAQASLPGTTKTVSKGTLTITGNPGEVPLKDVLAAVAEFVDYEAEVVEAAADEIDDPAIKEAAKDQAEAMKDAADSLTDAAEAANETAAEVFVETNVAAVDSDEEVITGNPLFSRKDYEHTAKIIKSAKDKGLDNAHVEQLVQEAINDYQADNPNFDPDRFRKAVYGNPIGGTDTLPGTSAVVPARSNPVEPNPDMPSAGPGVAAGMTDAKPLPVTNTSNPVPNPPSNGAADTAPASTHWYKKSWSKASK